MHGQRVSSVGPFLDPVSSEWSRLEAEHIPLMPTPLGMQPTEYIRVTWEQRPYGQVSRMRVSAVHDGERAALRLQWSAAVRDPGDAAAIALPVRGQPSLMTMGSQEAPIHALHWVAKEPRVRSVIAGGIGTTRAGPDVKASAQAAWSDGVWRLVITRALGTGKEIAALAPGQRTGIGFALWSGANHERAGIKAFSVDWREFTLDA